MINSCFPGHTTERGVGYKFRFKGRGLTAFNNGRAVTATFVITPAGPPFFAPLALAQETTGLPGQRAGFQ